MLALDVLAGVLVEYASEFTGCDGCDGTFDREFTDMRGGVFEDRYGREHEYPYLCPTCQVESLLDPRD